MTVEMTEENNSTEEQGISDSPDLAAELAKAREENKKLSARIHELNGESAGRRVEAREAQKQAKTLEEQVRDLQARLDTQDAETARAKALATHGLSLGHAQFLGNDPAQFDELAKSLADITKPQAGKPSPVGVERLQGGLDPMDDPQGFDPAEIIRSHRRR